MDETKSLVPIKSEPKEVFAHLFAVGALIASASALFGLLYAIIDMLFPPAGQVLYAEAYKSQMRFFISFLLVAFLLYVWVLRLVGKWEAADQDRKKIRVRKWMVYLTIFLSGVTLAGDAIAVLNSFLQGDFTAAFLLKALALAIIAALVFSWYRAYASEVMPVWSKFIRWGAGAIVALSLVSGFIAVGSPMQQRDIANDATRVRDLLQIQSSVTYYWQATQKLPTDLQQLYAADNGRFGPLPADPVTGKSYEYSVKDALTFQMCADFARAADKNQMTTYYQPAAKSLDGSSIANHQAGHQCFVYAIDTTFTKPYDTIPVGPKVPVSQPAPLQ